MNALQATHSFRPQPLIGAWRAAWLWLCWEPFEESVDGARWEDDEDCGAWVIVVLGLLGGKSSSESLRVIMLGFRLWPFPLIAPLTLVGVLGGVNRDDDNEIAADAAFPATFGTLHGFFILSAFCHLLHCHAAGAGQRLQAGSGPFLLGGTIASAVPGLAKSALP